MDDALTELISDKEFQSLTTQNFEIPSYKNFYLNLGNFVQIVQMSSICCDGFFYGIKVETYNPEQQSTKSVFLVGVNNLIDHENDAFRSKRFRRIQHYGQMYRDKYLMIQLLEQFGYRQLKKLLVGISGEEIELSTLKKGRGDSSVILLLDNYLKIHKLK